MFKNIARLIRLHHPIGIILLFWPCVWGLKLGYSTCVSVKSGETAANAWYIFFILGVGACLMRSLGCVVNDLVDYKFDAQVQRTQERPLANQQISLWTAYVTAIILALSGLYILTLIPYKAQLYSLIGAILMCLYPFMKRLTFYPQVILGLCFNTGCLVGYSCFCSKITLGLCFLMISGVFWTIAYDTIYAMNDVDDDKRLGLKSTAIRFENQKFLFLILCYTMSYLFFYMTTLSNILTHVIYILFTGTILFNVWKKNLTLAFKLHGIFSCFAILY